jgi:hypothetical protein
LGGDGATEQIVREIPMSSQTLLLGLLLLAGRFGGA